ncbi:MAG: peptide/nickel transport system ATP-binding protein [Chloroflexota bacterium]|nr:peptide/nickel transport system ATP-binding protein [Chloroflexota bacterium]
MSETIIRIPSSGSGVPATQLFEPFTLAQFGGEAADPTTVLEARDLVKHFSSGRGFLGRKRHVVHAVDGVSFKLSRGRTLGLVGESGCGKTTTGRVILGLEEPTAGEIRFDGVDVTRLRGAEAKRYRNRVQMVFQDPSASLDPKMRVGESVAEPLFLHGWEAGARAERVANLLDRVGLDPSLGSRYAHQLSGGQRQRVGIARALALEPEVIIADEPTSALDVSVRAQVINLLKDLQAELGVAYVFISHDLSTVRYVSDEVAVMYLGQIVERAPSEELFSQPLHPYTQALLDAVPIPDPRAEAQRHVMLLEGDVPDPAAPPSGCRFHTRCPFATADCAAIEPVLRAVAPGREVACHMV